MQEDENKISSSSKFRYSDLLLFFLFFPHYLTYFYIYLLDLSSMVYYTFTKTIFTLLKSTELKIIKRL